MSPKAPPREDVLKTLATRATDRFMHVRKRLGLLLRLDHELKAVGIDGRFLINNELVYRMVTDTYEMLVIDLASFCRGMYKPSGFICQLNNHLSKLGRPSKKELAGKEPWVRDSIYVPRETRFNRLFPNAKGDKPSQADTGALADRVAAISTRAVQLRSAIHAHRYEDDKKVGLTGLSLAELVEMFDRLEEILGDVFYLATNSTLDFIPVTYSSMEDTAKDVRDCGRPHGQRRTATAPTMTRSAPGQRASGNELGTNASS